MTIIRVQKVCDFLIKENSINGGIIYDRPGNFSEV